MNDLSSLSGYQYTDAAHNHAHDYLLPTVLQQLDDLDRAGGERRLFELGCGNGSVAHTLTQRGWDVIGVDSSSDGIRYANRHYPALKLYAGSAYDDLVKRYGRFPVVLSLEVVEHVYFPRQYAATLFSLLQNGGVALLSTPYHGYWKNLTIALIGKMDAHFTALWEHGHIKFWSINTLTILLKEAGFCNICFERVGRIPPLAKSMIAIAQRLDSSTSA